jgi:hypothetical protein
MIFQRGQKIRAGMEICADRIRSAVIQQNSRKLSVKNLSSVKILPDILQPSFKKENIVQPDAFKKCLVHACKNIPEKKIHVAVPDACIKLFIWQFAQLPADPAKIDAMILWRVANTYSIPAQALRISWENMGKNAENRDVFLIAMGMENVIAQYEDALKAAGLTPLLVAPAGLNQFNFYARTIPEKGIMAYLGLFDAYIALFVFDDGLPVFYRMTRKGMVSEKGGSAIDDMDLLMQYYKSEFPDIEIEKYFIASYIKSEDRVREIFQDPDNLDLTIVDETGLIRWDKQGQDFPVEHRLPFYTAALGAAQ